MKWTATPSCVLLVGPPSGRGGSSSATTKNFMINGKFNGPSIKTVLKNLDDLENQLPEEASSFRNYFDSIRKLHRMCTEDKLGENYEETIEELKKPLKMFINYLE